MLAINGFVFFVVVVSACYPLVRGRFVLPELMQSFLLVLLGFIHGFDVLAINSFSNYFDIKLLGLRIESILPLFVICLPLWLFQRDKSRLPSLLQGGFIVAALSFIPWVWLQPQPAIIFNPDVITEEVLFVGHRGVWFFITLCCYLLYAVYHIEQAILRLNRKEFWQGKYFAFGWAIILCSFLFCYSQPVLFRTYDLTLLPVRTLGLFIGSSLILYSRVWRGDVRKLMVSREVAFRSIVLLCVGIYLFLMAIGGRGFLYLDGTTKRIWLSAIFFCGITGLVVVLAMERFRRRIKVLLHKHFYRNKYEYRQQWMDYTKKLSVVENEQHLFHTILEFYCSTFGMTGGALFLREGEEKQSFTGCFYYACDRSTWPEYLQLSDCSVQALGDRDWILDHKNPQDNQAFSGILSTVDVRFIVPIHFNGNLEAILALYEPLVESEIYGYEDFDLMRMLAAQAGSILHGLRLRGQLANEREMAAIGKVSTFVVHDLKNLVTGLGMMSDNAKEYIHDPEFQTDMLETVDSSVSKMKQLIQRLRYLKESKSLKVVRCNLADIARQELTTFPSDLVEPDLMDAWVDADPFEIGKVIQNLIHNAIDATGADGTIWLSTGVNPRPFIVVRDNGIGMSDDFIQNRLFKPLETTKEKGLGIGLYQCRNIVESHGGGVHVTSKEGEGSTFTFWLPELAVYKLQQGAE